MAKLRAYFIEEFLAGKPLSPVDLAVRKLRPAPGGKTEWDRPALALPCINAHVRQVGSEADRTLEMVGSDESIDRYEEIISVAGWDLKNYRKNPVVLFGHDYRSLPVGQSLKVWKSMDGETKQLRFHLKFATAEAHALAESVYRLLQGGELRTSSVGFLPWDWEDFEGDEIPRDADGRATAPSRTYKKQDLLELSIVPVPANPNALVDAMQRGTIKEDTFNLLTRKYRMPAEREVIDLRRWASLREPERTVEVDTIDANGLRITFDEKGQVKAADGKSYVVCARCAASLLMADQVGGIRKADAGVLCAECFAKDATAEVVMPLGPPDDRHEIPPELEPVEFLEERAKPDPTTVQSLVLSKKVFKTEAAAKKWVTDNDFKAGTPDETENTWRFRQFNPDQCKADSFKTIKLTDGVMAVICHKKEAPAPEAVAPEAPQRTMHVEYLETSPLLEEALRLVLVTPQALDLLATEGKTLVQWNEAVWDSRTADRVLSTAKGLAVRRAFEALPEARRESIRARMKDGEFLDVTKDHLLLAAFLIAVNGGDPVRVNWQHVERASAGEEAGEVVLLTAIASYLGQLGDMVSAAAATVQTLVSIQPKEPAPTPEQDAAEDELEEAYLEVLHAAFEQMCATIATMKHLTCELSEDDDMPPAGDGPGMLTILDPVLREGAVLNKKNLARVKAIHKSAAAIMDMDGVHDDAKGHAKTIHGHAGDMLAEAEKPSEDKPEETPGDEPAKGAPETDEAILVVGEPVAVSVAPVPPTPAPPSPEGQEGIVIEMDPAMLAGAVKDGIKKALGELTGDVRYAHGKPRRK